MTRTVPIAEVASESLRGLPGYALRCFAERWLDRATLARVIDAALADVHAEWNQARAAGCTWRARGIAARGNAVLLLGLSAYGLGVLRADLPRLASIAAGALLFPLLLFALLSEAIRPAPVGPTLRETTIVDWWRQPPAPVIITPRREPPTKPARPRDGVPVHGDGMLPRVKAAPPGSEEHGTLFAEPIAPRSPDLPRGAFRRQSDALPLVRIPPDYPPDLLLRGIEGFVVVRLWIGTRGEVTRAEVVRAQPRRAFERAALAAVRRWRYQPGESDGEAVERGPIEVLLDFKLRDVER